MLEEQNGRFASRSSVPVKGYLKVETGNNKGALRCVVQNLKYYEKGDYRYKLILFGRRGERTIHTIIGDLLVNRQGNGESYFRFLPEDVDGKGNPYHLFTTVIIAAASTKDEKEPLHPVLKGVTANEEDPFRTGLMNELDEPEAENQQLAAASMKDPQDQPEAQEHQLEAQERQPLPTTPTEAQDLQPLPPSSPEAQGEVEVESTSRQNPAPSKKVYNRFYNEYILNACAHTCRNAEFYEDIAPFEKDKTEARWKKIVNVASLPVVSPGAHYFSTCYRHYIFGAKPDDSGVATKFFFGIPGRFMAEEQPDGGRSGFTYWQPIRGAEPFSISAEQIEAGNRKAYGYWILAVDGKTGNIEEV